VNNSNDSFLFIWQLLKLIPSGLASVTAACLKSEKLIGVFVATILVVYSRSDVLKLSELFD